MDKLLMRSAEFEQKVFQLLELPPYDDSNKIRLSKIMCSVALEHAESFKILLASRNFTSAMGLLRSQFDCFVRFLCCFRYLFYVFLTLNSIMKILNDLKNYQCLAL